MLRYNVRHQKPVLVLRAKLKEEMAASEVTENGKGRVTESSVG